VTFEVGDEVEYRTGGGLASWRAGTVLAVLPGPRRTDFLVATDRGSRVENTVPEIWVRRPRTRKVVQEQRLPGRGPARSEKYLAYIRTLSCAGCGAPGPSDPHHFGARGVGQKCGDYQTTPLCRGCHDSFHALREIPGRNVAETRGDLLAAQVVALVRWITVGA
jgi:hypothetical protein